MPNETLEAPIDSDERISVDEAEQVGEAALDAVPIVMDSDPARLIHEEFPSVSSRPEAVPQTNIEAEPNLEDQKNLEVLPSVERPEIPQTIEDFEQLLGQSLPEEVKQQIAELKEEKLEGIKKQVGELSGLREKLEAPPCSEWIKEGEIVVPLLTEATGPDFMKTLEQRLESYLQTPAGKAAQKDRQLETFAANPKPTKYEIAEAAKLLGLPLSEARLKLMPGHSEKVAAEVRAKIDQHFRDFYDDGLDDIPGYGRKSPEEERASELGKISSEINGLVNFARQEYGKEITESHLLGRYSEEETLAQLPDKLDQLDQARLAHVQEILQTASTSPLDKTLEALAKGHITIEEVAGLLREAEGPQIRQIGSELKNMARRFESETYTKLWESLPEPSLVGLDVSEADIDLVSQGFDRMLEITALLGQKPGNKADLEKILKDEIAKSQKEFFAAIGSENDMYWHFSPFGLRIFESKQLSPSSVTGNVMTADHSRSLHFIKPGLTSMDSMVDYTGYAQSGVRLGFSGEKLISDGFGVAVIYPLGKLAEALPFRDEPAREDHTSPDTVFRESEGEAQKSLTLENAYILPMQTSEQIRALRGHPDFKDLFSDAWQSPLELQLAVTRRAAELAGYSQEWIDEHILQPIPLGETTKLSERDVYAPVSQQIRARLPESKTMIVPLTARAGAFETHDVNGGESKSAGWHERLVKLELPRVNTGIQNKPAQAV